MSEVPIYSFNLAVVLRGYLAHKKQPPPLGSPLDPRHRATVGSYGGGLFLWVVNIKLFFAEARSGGAGSR